MHRTAVARALRKARALLRQRGEACAISMDTFIRWLHTDTPYPNPTFEETVRNPYFVVHELVEIREVRRMGLRITKDVILRHPLEVDRAHARAARVEFETAAADGAIRHLENRLRDVRGWIQDPTVAPEMRTKYRDLYRETAHVVRRSKAEKARGKGT